jgi:hypothetical protein
LTSGKVDHSVDTVLVRVQRARDVVAVETQIQREVVTSPCGDDDKGDAVLARDRRDECLGAIAASHAQQVGAACDCILGELAQVVAWA